MQRILLIKSCVLLRLVCKNFLEKGNTEKVGAGALVRGGYAYFSCIFKKETEWGKANQDLLRLCSVASTVDIPSHYFHPMD